MNLIGLIIETRASSGKGSAAGRAKMLTSGKKSHTNPVKSKMRVFPSINKAVARTKPGDTWSTKGSDRAYVTTMHKWGKKRQQTVSGRTAKGFRSIKAAQKFAKNTMKRYRKIRSKGA